MLPSEIQYLLDNYDAEDISISIKTADYSGDKPRIVFTIHELGNPSQTWTLEIIRHVASELSFTYSVTDTTIILTDDHPLLWKYSDIHGELYFNGSCKNTYKIVSELNQTDFELFGKYQNSSEQLYSLLRSSNGLLAKGPEKLLSKYEDCLNRNGIKTSLVAGYSPSYFDGINTINGEILKIFLFGGSYIVAQDFIFNKKTFQ